VFLYLLTNQLTNICGVYEITDRQVSFDTGYTIDVVRVCFQRFQEHGKIIRRGDWVAFKNWIKHQSLAPGVQGGIAKLLSAVPKDMADFATGGSTPVEPTLTPGVEPTSYPILSDSIQREVEAHRPVHMLLAESWYRAYSAKTARMVSPGEDDYLKAEKVCARMDPAIAESTIPAYFSGEWWFTRDKTTKKATYSFGSWVAHIEELIAAGPVKPKAKGWPCPHCGAVNTHSGGVCSACHEDRVDLAAKGEA
jgi:hypothetical protein